MKISSLEKKIISILDENEISYEKEKQYKDCYNGKYLYDFFIPKFNCLVEVNGNQHYEFTKFFYKTKSDFMKAQERDRRKISYALAQGMKLYIIPYWEMDGLTQLSDIFQEKFLARNKFHNDEIYREYKSSTTH